MSCYLAAYLIAMIGIAGLGSASGVTCFPITNPVVFITSYYSGWYNKMKYERGFENTILQQFPENNLVIYHEDDVPDVPGACMINLMEIAPWLLDELTNSSSGLNQYGERSGYSDPLNGYVQKGDVRMGHILLMKVRIMYILSLPSTAPLFAIIHVCLIDIASLCNKNNFIYT